MPRGRRPIRLLILHPRDLAVPSLGGIQTFLHDLVKHAPADFEITLAGVTSDARRRPVGRLQRIEVGGRSAWLLPLASAGGPKRDPVELLRMLAAQIRLRRLMFDRGTILQVHRPYRGVVLAGHRGPRIQFVHLDLRAWPGPSGWSRLRLLYRPFSSAALNSMDRIFVVNEPGADLLRSAHPHLAERVEFLPVWVDEQVFMLPTRVERGRLRATLAERLAMPASATADQLVLFAGRLDPIKEPALALNSFAELVVNGRAVRLLIAGDGKLRQVLESQVAQLGLTDRVHFMGDVARDDLAIVMRACDVLILSSRAEGGGPRVVLEALASGLPVVATEVGEIRRVVRHGVNGWLTEDHQPAALVAGLCWALDGNRDQLASAARLAIEPYTARRVLSRLYEAYRELSTLSDRD